MPLPYGPWPLPLVGAALGDPVPLIYRPSSSLIFTPVLAGEARASSQSTPDGIVAQSLDGRRADPGAGAREHGVLFAHTITELSFPYATSGVSLALIRSDITARDGQDVTALVLDSGPTLFGLDPLVVVVGLGQVPPATTLAVLHTATLTTGQVCQQQLPLIQTTA